MKMLTYVNFPGTCAEAFRFYEKHLGGKPGMMMTHGEAPDQTSVKPELKDAILHARISISVISIRRGRRTSPPSARSIAATSTSVASVTTAVASTCACARHSSCTNTTANSSIR